MADSLTVIYDYLRATETGIDPTNSATATGVGAKNGLIGPPRTLTEPHMQGRFVRQTSGASGTYRWVADERITGDSPTSFLYVGLST